MSTSLPLASQQSIFLDREPVIQTHSRLEGAVPPSFGSSECWDLNGVVPHSVSIKPTAMRIWFPTTDPVWNLLGREIAMIWLNPRHPAVLARGLHLPVTPLDVVTVSQRVAFLRALAEFAAERGLPSRPEDWADQDFHAYIGHRLASFQASSTAAHVHVIKALHRMRPALACGGLSRDPWPGKSSNAVVNHPIVPPLTTPVIKPETWFPLVRAAWTYIDVFSPDILRAAATWRTLQAGARKVGMSEADRLLCVWIADPSSKVPIDAPDGSTGSVNWSLLCAMAGFSTKTVNPFGDNRPGRERRALVERMVAAGSTQTGLLDGLVEVERPDATRGPWHPSLHPLRLWQECVMLRDACYVFVAALSMMRDSEIREIVHGSVVEHYGSPAVKSTKRKLDADLPTKHWWIIDPVAKAIDIAAQLSLDPQLAFAAVRDGYVGDGFVSQHAVRDFIRHVNKTRQYSGLPLIPPQKVTPHMFRRTMAMLTRDFPGSEIAVGMQLKHVASRALANRTTQNYMDYDPSWARELDRAIAERRFERLKELFDADGRGERIGYGPGAERMRESFAAVRHKADGLRASGQAQYGDVRVEYDLLRRTRISIRFGTLNHCTMNDDDPTGAKCLEEAIVPEGHQGPLLDRCQPARCPNSVLGPEHLPLWKTERTSLTRLLAMPAIPPPRRAALNAQLHEVNLMIKKAEP